MAAPVRFGWEELAPDDATYLYVGRTVLDGRLPTDPVGEFYASRSPLYPVMLAAADGGGRTDLLGPRLVVWALALGGLAGGVLLARRLGGDSAAIGTAAALATTPAIWLTISSLRIDLPISAGIVAAIAALGRPTTRRWLLAGLLVGAVVLAKETTALLLLLPLAWWGVLERRQWLALSGRYTASALAVVSWWWALVWVREGDFAPLAGAQRVAEATQTRVSELNGAAWGLVILFAAGWTAFAIRYRHDPRARVVTIAGAALAIPAAMAWYHELALRQFVPLAVLSCVTLGTVVGPLVAHGLRRAGWHRTIAVTVCVATLVAASVSQLRLEPLYRRPTLAAAAANWLEPRLEPDAVVAMNSLSRSELAYRLYGRASVDVAPFRFPDSVADPEQFVWLGVFGDRLFGLERSDMRAWLTDDNVGYLVLFSPHRTAPRTLRSTLAEPGLDGIDPVAVFVHDDQRVEIFAVDPHRVADAIERLPATISVEARERLDA